MLKKTESDISINKGFGNNGFGVTEQFLTGTGAESLVTSYNPWMIALSYVIACFGSYISLILAEMLLDSKKGDRGRTKLHVLGAVVLGCTIWSMHFIGMLAYQTNMLVRYDPAITAISMAIAIACAYAAFQIVRHGQLSSLKLAQGGILLGMGVAAMHYAGMSAMQMDARLTYVPVYFAASVAIAIGASGTALWLFFHIGRLPAELRILGRMLAALVMGLAITGMHYMGMRAAIMTPFADCRFVATQDFHGLAMAVAAVTCVIFGTGLMLAIRERERRIASDVSVAFPSTLVSLGLGLTVLAIVWLGAANAYNQQVISTATARNVEAGQLSYNLIRLDARVSRFARRQLHTETADWGDTYKQEAENLQNTIKTIAEKYPDAGANPADSYVMRLVNARSRLGGLEADAVNLARQDRVPEADALMDSIEYAAQKDIYARAARDFHERITSQARTGLMTVARQMYLSIYPVVASIVILAIVWYFVFRALHAWRFETEAARRASERASDAKSDFLANMSHEIRSPMNAIMGLSSILLRTPLTPEQENWTRIIHKSGENLLGVINDILDFSKIAAGKLTLEFTPFDVYRMVGDVTDLFAVAAREKNITMMVAIDPNVPRHVTGDATRIRQIVTNFFSNAVKFTEKGHIAIQVGARADRAGSTLLTIAVLDTGIGIAADRLDYIFEKFSQVEEGANRNYGGTGLGLAISKSLAAKMKGSVAVTSVEGQGSTFSVTIPVGVVEETGNASGASLTGRRVLVIESYAPERDNMVQALNRLKLKGAGCETPADAPEQEFDFILLDAGYCDAPTIRDLKLRTGGPAGQNGPRIVVLGNIDSTAGERDFSTSGAAGYLTKPVTPEHLQAALGMLFGDGDKGVFVTRAVIDAQNQPEAAPVPKRYKDRSVLVVDDMKVNQLIMQKILEDTGCDINYASSGAQALEMMRAKAYDIVFMDCQMPGIDGFEATRTIRAERPGQDRAPVIIALTADAMTGDREKCIAAGMNDYINKPFTAEQIAKMLENWIA